MVTRRAGAPTDRRATPPVPIIGRALEPLYRLELARRNRAFDRGDGVTALDIPVISVGNLSVGGTGKTPMVRAVVERLRALGRTPMIAMRGYRAPAGGRSDEELEYEDALGDVPIVAQADRLAGVAALRRERSAIDVVVLDDGFQHRRIARGLDIVLVDATRSPFEDRCLPAGGLREPASSLARAGLVVLTRTGGVERLEELEGRVRGVTGAPIVRSDHAWGCIEVGDDERRDASWLGGRRVIAACAIGHPSAFVRQAQASGAGVVESVCRRDHHAWDASETAALERTAREREALVLTTGKDWVKLREHATDAALFARPIVEIRFAGDGETAVARALGDALA